MKKEFYITVGELHNSDENQTTHVISQEELRFLLDCIASGWSRAVKLPSDNCIESLMKDLTEVVGQAKVKV